jgi:hypothetical protein
VAQYLLTLHRTAPFPALELPVQADNDEEATDLARLHMLMSRRVTRATAHRNGEERFSVGRDDPA